MDNDDLRLAPPVDAAESESVPISDMSPVLSFLSGKNCLTGVSARSMFSVMIVCGFGVLTQQV